MQRYQTYILCNGGSCDKDYLVSVLFLAGKFAESLFKLLCQ